MKRSRYTTLAQVSALDIRYEWGHPGTRCSATGCPRLELGNGERTRIADCCALPAACWSSPASRELARTATGWADSVDTVTGEWARPRRQATLTTALTRPDGYIAEAAAGCCPRCRRSTGKPPLKSCTGQSAPAVARCSACCPPLPGRGHGSARRTGSRCGPGSGPQHQDGGEPSGRPPGGQRLTHN
jgi:hypothetical protein